jgi:hypothetical protein
MVSSHYGGMKNDQGDFSLAGKPWLVILHFAMKVKIRHTVQPSVVS